VQDETTFYRMAATFQWRKLSAAGTCHLPSESQIKNRSGPFLFKSSMGTDAENGNNPLR
jgi:hypothetical protein